MLEKMYDDQYFYFSILKNIFVGPVFIVAIYK